MYELIPLFAGVAAGLGAAEMHSARARALLIAAVTLIAGLAASVLSGEISDSFAFVLWDMAQAALAAVAALALVRAWRASARA